MPDAPPSDKPRSVKPVPQTPLLVFLVAVAVMACFEYAKQFLLKDPGSWELRIATVVFSGAVAAIAAFWIIRRELAMKRLLSAQIQEKQEAESRSALFAHTLKSISECVIITDMQDNILHLNTAFLQTYGYSEHELLGKSIALVRSDRNDSEVTKQILPATIRGGWQGELWNRRKDGSDFKIYLSTSLVSDDEGRPVALVGVAMDLTRNESAQRALMESEKRFQSIIANSHAGYFFINEQGQYQQVNAAWLQLHRYKSSSEIIGQHFTVTQTEVEKAKRIFGQAMEGQYLPSFDLSLRCKDGSIGYATVSISTVFREGRIVGLDGFIIDTSEHRRAELAHQELERRLHELLQTVDLLAVMVDLSGNITFCNNFLCKVTGWSTAELLGKDWFDLFVEESVRKGLREKFTPLLDSATIPQHYEYPILARDGTRLLVEWDTTLLRNPGGAVIGSASVGRDITNLRALEERLRHAHKQESLGRLAGRIAHDFNNLLTVINGYSELLLDRVESTSPLKSGLADIRKAGEKAAALNQQLLAFSQKQILQRKALDLNAVVADAEEMLNRLFGEGIELVLALDPRLSAVRVDGDQLYQVLMSLAAYSRDAMAPRGRLSIRTENVRCIQAIEDEQELVPPGHYVQLSLSDTGAGISVEARRHLFSTFHSTAGLGQGTGLSFPNVYAIIQQNDGHLLVESTPGKGTTFKILFPAVAEPLTPVQEEARNDKPESAGTETILLVEDQEEVRQLAGSILRSNGYQVMEAAGGEEALRICTGYSGRIDLVISDIVMPRMSGVDLVKRLKPGFPNTPVLFMSGYDRDTSDEGLVTGEGSFFISKPFTIQAFTTKVREILAASRGKRRILVADDEPAIRNLLREILVQAGFEVVEAPDGKAAIAEIRNRPVDLVLTDLVMPEREGLETIQILRRDFPAIKIIAMSGAFGGEFLNPAKLLGAHATLLKPISRSAILEAVKEVLN